MTEQFRVAISGRTISGAPLADIKDAVGRVFKLQGEALERMVSGRAMIVARACDKAAAEKLLARLQALDLEARIDALPGVAPAPAAIPSAPPEKVEAKPDELFALAGPAVSAPIASPAVGGEALAPAPAVAAEVVCPKCGAAQPKRTLCRQCGLDMPRYLAAQEAAEREARAEREAEREARRQSPGGAWRGSGEQPAGVLGLGFSGRLGRLDYFSASMLSTTLLLLFVLAGAATGKTALAGLGLFLWAIYSIRCIVLRLHDTGKTGWLALIVVVPVLGTLMTLALLFIGSDGDENEYGTVATDGDGRRAILVLVALFVVSGLSYRSLSQSPEKAMRFLEAMSVGQGKSAAAASDDDDDEPTAARGAVRYASTNRIDIYVMAGCGACDQMRAWISANGLNYTVYAVDSDQHAAERLQSILAGDGQGRIMLPVLEINGKVLPGNPPIGDLHRYLRQEAP